LISVDQKNCRIQLLVVFIFRKLKQNRKSDDDDDDAVNMLCSQRYNMQTVKLTLSPTSTNLDDMSYMQN